MDVQENVPTKVVHLNEMYKKVFLCIFRKINRLAGNRKIQLTHVYIYTYESCICIYFYVNCILRFPAKRLIFRKKQKNTFL